MAPQMGSQKDDSEIQEMAMLPPSTTRRTSCLRLQIEGDDKQSRRVTFAPGTKEMSENTKAPVSTPTKKRNTWNPALGWKIDPSVKLSFDVVDLYRGPRLGELATYANSYYQQKRRLSSTSSSSSRFQSDGMNVNVVDTSPLKRSQNSNRLQSEKLSDSDDANITKEMDMDTFLLPRMQGSPRLQSEKLSSDFDATSANDDIDMDTYPLPRMHGNSRLQSEKLSDSMAGSSSSPLKHRRTCRSDLPSPGDIILLTTNMDIENQPPSPPPVVYHHQDNIHEYHHENNHQNNENNQPNNALLLVNMNMMTTTSQKQSVVRNCFDQTMRSTTPSSSSKCDVLLPTMISETTTKNITTTSTLPIHLPTTIDTIITNLIKPPSKNHIVDDDTMFFFHSSTSLTFPGSNRSMKRPRSTVLAYRCFVCFFLCFFVFLFV